MLFLITIPASGVIWTLGIQEMLPSFITCINSLRPGDVIGIILALNYNGHNDFNDKIN